MAALVVVACAGKAAEPLGAGSSAIVGGADDFHDPAVVRIPSANCSGTLVAPRAVLTAAHCGVVAGATVSFSDGTSAAALAFHAHPSWDSNTTENDVAVVVLGQPSAVAPVPLSTTPFTDAFVGMQVRIVGYGETGDGAAAGVKRFGFTTIAGYGDTSFTDSAQPAASCAGDSGGPALMTVGGVERVVGVTSRGDSACATFGVKTRVDAYAASFLAPAIAATQPSSLAVGVACDGDVECASGRCATAADSNLVHYCSAPCAGDDQCPATMRCRSGGCSYDPPSPGALGAPCEANGDCAGGLCATATFGGARSCTVLCKPAATSPCSSGFTCASADADGGSMCFPEKATTTSGSSARGGCTVGPADSNGFAAVIIIMVAVLGLHVRRGARAILAPRGEPLPSQRGHASLALRQQRLPRAVRPRWIATELLVRQVGASPTKHVCDSRWKRSAPRDPCVVISCFPGRALDPTGHRSHGSRKPMLIRHAVVLASVFVAAPAAAQQPPQLPPRHHVVATVVKLLHLVLGRRVDRVSEPVRDVEAGR